MAVNTGGLHARDAVKVRELELLCATSVAKWQVRGVQRKWEVLKRCRAEGLSSRKTSLARCGVEPVVVESQPNSTVSK